MAARQLGLAGWQVTMLERAEAPRPDGYMMDFFGPGVEASERIGLHPYLAKAAYRVQAAEYVDAHGTTTASLDYEKFSQIAGGNVLTLLRPEMEAAARAALEDVKPSLISLHYGVQIEQLEETGQQVKVQLAGWSQPITGDLLVGADGMHSTVRAAFFGPEEAYLHHLGMRAAAFIVHEPDLNRRFKNRFVMTDTVDLAAGIYGLRTQEVAAFLVYRHDPDTPLGTTRDRLRHVFAGCGAHVDRLMELCPEEPYDDSVAQVLMDSWCAGPVVLIGDAAAAVSLLAGQGGAMAVCAGAALGDALGSVTEPRQCPLAWPGTRRSCGPRLPPPRLRAGGQPTVSCRATGQPCGCGAASSKRPSCPGSTGWWRTRSSSAWRSRRVTTHVPRNRSGFRGTCTALTLSRRAGLGIVYISVSVQSVCRLLYDFEYLRRRTTEKKTTSPIVINMGMT
ncbi:FAD-dependent monooxygenase [Glutamicibacter arilaitensis]|uniref:FAD-dependent monooxygenase n=1 Tax=Glutamicibacter arilaitensis TaxID=256701 RepID=UPI0021D537E0|nr:FAD-dependent monooxygenase [Glutamicibacter arilaitensis]